MADKQKTRICTHTCTFGLVSGMCCALSVSHINHGISILLPFVTVTLEANKLCLLVFFYKPL